MPRRSRRKSHPRKKLASEAVNDLYEVLNENKDHDISNSAAKLILRIGKKHGTRVRNYNGITICRSCSIAMVPGRNSTVRIRSKVVKYTCGVCGRVKTIGPSFVM